MLVLPFIGTFFFSPPAAIPRSGHSLLLAFHRCCLVGLLPLSKSQVWATASTPNITKQHQIPNYICKITGINSISLNWPLGVCIQSTNPIDQD